MHTHNIDVFNAFVGAPNDCTNTALLMSEVYSCPSVDCVGFLRIIVIRNINPDSLFHNFSS
jgi:hypothetical protein